MNNPKIVHILKCLNDAYLGSKTETVSVEGALTVEHILPLNWIEYCPLPNVSKGLSWTELVNAEQDDTRIEATRRRNAELQTLGNLTILTQALNSAASNSAWKEKKPKLMRHSLLPINQKLHDVETWDESAIVARSDALLKQAINIWPRC